LFLGEMSLIKKVLLYYSLGNDITNIFFGFNKYLSWKSLEVNPLIVKKISEKSVTSSDIDDTYV
jgi:hypothetical protein